MTTTNIDRLGLNPEERKESGNALAFDERRLCPRCPFTAAVTAVEPASQTEIDAHTTDLSLGGCYVDAMNPLPAGTEIHLRLTKNGKSFHAKTRIVYSTPSVGMGLLFTEMARSQRPVLERWFAELRGDSPPEPPVVERNGQGAQAAALEGGERYAIEDLVILLTQRHVLTEDEGESILRRMTE